ncbi:MULTISPECIES: MarR family winged helix-turn-helix transcriptional regulator [Acidobacteriaceae]|uniref:MarR family winged helix-turn-helix transcriptional regulator n=1 Tax=Acidobacteriaceae TaxID=204434 RepID=UPI00131D1637|nr:MULTISPECIES: MarR family transcriptional regulator [Acidobacteriaceae]MDW5266340.1 MarR family transcriptional regulator [Edaphobacter sp.]
MRIEPFLKQSPIFQITRSARRLDALLTRILRKEEVTFLEALVLAAIFFEKKRGIKPSELAETFETTRGNVSHCISSLEARGLVRRRVDPEDSRAFQLTLQPAGRKRAARVVGILDQMQNRYEGINHPPAFEAMLRQMFIVESICTGLAQTAGEADQRSRDGLEQAEE